MKSKSSTTLALQVVTSFGTLWYLLFIAMIVFHDSYPIFKSFTLIELLLIIFLSGYILSWTKNKLAAGIVFMVWNTIVWLSDLYFARPDQDYSMLSAMASFFMFCGAFFLLEWYKTSKVPAPSQKKQWKFTLQVLIINYVVLYFIVVFSELTVGEPINYMSFPYIIYPLLLFIFLLGFLISWEKELIAGYVFLIWFAILIYANVAYSEIGSLGGWALFGLPILLQGIFYLNNHRKFKTRK